MIEWNYKSKLSSTILIQDDLMATCSTNFSTTSKELILLLLFFGNEKNLQCSFKH